MVILIMRLVMGILRIIFRMVIMVIRMVITDVGDVVYMVFMDRYPDGQNSN